jgi:uncharacterized membrane protein
LPDPLASQLWSVLRFLPPLVLLWLAWFFGRTLRRGAVPLIEQIARRGTPDMPPALCRYTRGLTGVWCVYFLLAAALMALSKVADLPGHGRTSALVWGGTVLLFVGERGLRPLLFPGRRFPGLWQQLRDTWAIWHPPRETRPEHRD